MYDWDWDELEAAGLCECGQPSDPSLHPRLPNPKPLSSWMARRNIDGVASRAARDSKHSETPIMLAGSPAKKTYKQKKITGRMLQVVDTVRRHGGNKSSAARELGISYNAVYMTIERAKELNAA